mmetsp:Transcript_114463/g.369980  ORF Transcript_114463/g.369980 Transcript_114463/m.369980 type:complete len:476 (-) Transcript_114463:881-2308(-)
MAAGLICLLSSMSYMELSSRLPTKGSCYVFSYHGLGELAGVVGAVCLTMEYGISGAGVARNWSAKLSDAIGYHPVLCYNLQPYGQGCDEDDDYYLDPIAAVMTLLCTGIVARGLNMGKIVINAFTFAKIALVAFLIVAGLASWTGNQFDNFAPRGAPGVIRATSLLFFGFIGFDEVCCMASKADNPVKTMPRALAGTLIGAALFSGLAQFSLSAMVPYTEGMKSIGFEEAFANEGLVWARWLVAVGELVLLPLVVLLSVLPQPEVTAAMAEDGLLPPIFRQTNRKGTYVKGTWLCGSFLTLVAFTVPFVVLWDVITLGVLMSFNLTNAALINMRYGNGGALRKPWVDALVWFLMITLSIAGFTFNQGILTPLLEEKAVKRLSMVFFGLSSVCALAIMGGIRFGFETRLFRDMVRYGRHEHLQGLGCALRPRLGNVLQLLLARHLALDDLGVLLGVLDRVFHPVCRVHRAAHDSKS